VLTLIIKPHKMPKKSTQTLFIISLVLTGIFLWLSSYIPLLKNWKAIATFVLLLALITTLLSKETGKMIVLAVSCGYMGAYIIRIIIDVISDPTSHNLLPFEIILLTLNILPAALIGFGLGFVVKKLF